MNLAYILILIIEANGFPVSTSQAEYVNEDRCNKAKEALEKKYQPIDVYKFYGVCVKK